MELYFITSNKGKFEEAKEIIPSIKQLDMDLPEIQEIDAMEVVKAKLLDALEIIKKMSKNSLLSAENLFIEDTSLYIDCLNGLPGPLIKWFLKTMGNDGLFKITEKMGNNRAQARTIIGYAENDKEILFFEGIVKGEIVEPKGSNRFGWDNIFQPLGHDKRFSEMGIKEKNEISMRRMALDLLRNKLRSEIFRF